MPLMPAPPMPTKWTRLTLCFIVAAPQAMQASATRSAASRRASLRPAIGHREQRLARERREARGQPFGREIRLRDRERRAGSDEKLRVRALLVGDRARQRHDDRGHAHGRELRDGDGAAAAEDDVGVGVVRRHVVDERHALRRDAAPLVCGAQRVEMPRAGLMHDVRARGRRHQRERLRNAAIDRRRAETSADDEEAQRAGAAGKPRLGRRHAAERFPHGIAHPLDLARDGGRASHPESRAGSRSAKRASTRFASPAIALASCSTSGFAQRDARERAGHRREPAEPEHDVRRAAADDLPALPPRGRERERAEHRGLSIPCPGRRGTRRPRIRRRAGARAHLPCRRACRARTRASRARRASPRRPTRENVAAGAARGDHHGAGHVAPPKRAARVSPEGAARPWGGPAAACAHTAPRCSAAWTPGSRARGAHT